MVKAITAVFVIICITVSMSGCSADTNPGQSTTYQKGAVTKTDDTYGVFFVYIPLTINTSSDILVLIHGTPAKEESADATAEYYIDHWRDFADEYGYALIAPAFDQQNFSSRKGEIEDSMTGYRGLFGREIAADEWVLRLVKGVLNELGTTNQKFYLYGHSAGGQFVGRFLVTHPEYVEKAVISAAATYPQPDPELAWPFGMGELHTDIVWDQETTKTVDIIPDKQKWLAATQVPLTVIVGMNDTAELPQRPGQQGRNRITIGSNWVQAMQVFAQENSLACLFHFEAIPGKGHSMSGLVPYSQAALQRQPVE